MEGLLNFSKLVTLNLANNGIRVVEGLENCTELISLDLSHNRIEAIADCMSLQSLPKLAHLDLKTTRSTTKTISCLSSRA